MTNSRSFAPVTLLVIGMLTCACTQPKSETQTTTPALQPAQPPKMVPLESADAQYQKGIAYLRGVGVSQDLKQAADLFRKAADRGHALAQYNLGAMYGWGSGMTVDMAQAITWFQKAAMLGVTKAQLNLGLVYANGDGVKKDITEAKKWLQMAADKGDPEAPSVLEQLKKNNKAVLVCPSTPKAKLCGPLEH